MLFRGEEYNEEQATKFDEALGWLNTMLDGKAFVAGDNMTIADISMVVTMSNIDVSELFLTLVRSIWAHALWKITIIENTLLGNVIFLKTSNLESYQKKKKAQLFTCVIFQIN